METQFVIGPNASLTPAQAVGFMASISVVALGIALMFAARGFWPIVPLAGLELAALGAALTVSLRRNRYREVVRIEAEAVAVAFGETGRGALREFRLPRAWTRVELLPGENRLAPSRLRLACGAQRVELARCLTDEERGQLATRLQAVIRRGGMNDRRPSWARPDDLHDSESG